MRLLKALIEHLGSWSVCCTLDVFPESFPFLATVASTFQHVQRFQLFNFPTLAAFHNLKFPIFSFSQVSFQHILIVLILEL